MPEARSYRTQACVRLYRGLEACGAPLLLHVRYVYAPAPAAAPSAGLRAEHIRLDSKHRVTGATAALLQTCRRIMRVARGERRRGGLDETRVQCQTLRHFTQSTQTHTHTKKHAHTSAHLHTHTRRHTNTLKRSVVKAKAKVNAQK